MKANKALKRLAKIEALISSVMERYSASAPGIREALDDAKAAITRAKKAVKNPPFKRSELRSKATPELSKPKRRISKEGMKRIVAATKKRWARVRAEGAKAQPARAKKTARKKSPVKKAIATKPAPASVTAATEAAGQ
jgi:hypothetical protein